jgi:cytoskeletal protein CcmA (bactofilin family)
MEVEGLIVKTTGTPATQISVVARDTSSSATNMPSLGSTVEVAVDSKTKFDIKNDVSLDSLPFTPSFDGSHISMGQEVEIDADGNSTQPIEARKISLREQTVLGTLSGIQVGPVTSFTLTVPADSAFAKLTGLQSITVYQVSGTDLHGLTLTNNATVRVRGLLFVDGASLKMVAKRISKEM